VRIRIFNSLNRSENNWMLCACLKHGLKKLQAGKIQVFQAQQAFFMFWGQNRSQCNFKYASTMKVAQNVNILGFNGKNISNTREKSG
jgi:hypothetical protein